MPAAYKIPYLRAKRRKAREAARRLQLAEQVRVTFDVPDDVWESGRPNLALWPTNQVRTLVVDGVGGAPDKFATVNEALTALPRNGNGRSVSIFIKPQAQCGGIITISQQLHGYNQLIIKGVL